MQRRIQERALYRVFPVLTSEICLETKRLDAYFDWQRFCFVSAYAGYLFNIFQIILIHACILYITDAVSELAERELERFNGVRSYNAPEAMIENIPDDFHRLVAKLGIYTSAWTNTTNSKPCWIVKTTIISIRTSTATHSRKLPLLPIRNIPNHMDSAGTSPKTE